MEVTASPAGGWASLTCLFAKPAGSAVKEADGPMWWVASVAAWAQNVILGRSGHLRELHSHQLEGVNGLACTWLLSQCSSATRFHRTVHVFHQEDLT